MIKEDIKMCANQRTPRFVEGEILSVQEAHNLEWAIPDIKLIFLL